MQTFSDVNITTLSPVQKMELADVLYDAAMLEIEAIVPLLNAEQVRELDRRIDRLYASETTLAA